MSVETAATVVPWIALAVAILVSLVAVLQARQEAARRRTSRNHAPRPPTPPPLVGKRIWVEPANSYFVFDGVNWVREVTE